MLKEFKAFISKGSVIDLAVGIIIGVAFKTIVSSLVGDVIMPLVGMAFGGISFADLSFTIGSASVNYGLFIQAIVDFLIIAFVIFLIIKGINRLRKKKEEAPAPPPEPSKEEALLTEIRNLLKEKSC